MQSSDYNEGELGRMIVQQYVTSELEPPRWNWMQPGGFQNCDDGSYFFMSPRGNVPDATFYIMDHECVCEKYRLCIPGIS